MTRMARDSRAAASETRDCASRTKSPAKSAGEALIRHETPNCRQNSTSTNVEFIWNYRIVGSGTVTNYATFMLPLKSRLRQCNEIITFSVISRLLFCYYVLL